MTFRFEEEDFKNTYILEDYYCTNPFCDCNHVTVSLCDTVNLDNRLTFLLNFNKTQSPLPNQSKPTKKQSNIVKEFIKNLPDELITLFKQRYMEAKAYGEKKPISYLIFEPGRYINFFEMFPREREMLDFNYEGDKHFMEDSYEIDSRNNNRDIKMVLYKLELDNEKQPPIFSYTYYFDEASREKEDAGLEPTHNDMVLALNNSIPNLYDILKQRYKKAKKLGEELMKIGSQTPVIDGKINPNDPCPCGSGKKYKKCCSERLN